MHSDFLIDGEKAPSATELTRLLPQDWLWAYYQREVKRIRLFKIKRPEPLFHEGVYYEFPQEYRRVYAGWRGWQRCKAHSNRAMRLGTHTHGLVEMALTGRAYIPYLDNGHTILEPERRLKLVRAWAKALIETTQKDTVKRVEEKVVHTARREHGTLDCLVWDDEINGLKAADWKTSGSIGIDYPIQLAIYARCWNNEHYDQIKVGEIQRVDKELKSKKAQETGEHHVQIKRFDNLEQYYPVIDALHVIYDYVNKVGQWKLKEKASV